MMFTEESFYYEGFNLLIPGILLKPDKTGERAR